MIDATALLLVENDFQQPATIHASPRPLAYDFNGIDQIRQDGVMHGSQRTTAWPFLCLIRATTVGSFWSRENAA